MSSKVYNGWVLKDTTLETGLAICKALRDACLPKAQAAIAKEVAVELAVRADLKANGLEPEKDSIESLMDVWKVLQAAKEVVLGKNIRKPQWDYAFDLVLIPKDSDLLALVFMENDPGYEQAMTDLGFQDYHYQNQTDKPKDISEEDWEQRRKDWHDCGLLQYEAPNTLGFSFAVVNWNDLFNPVMDKALVEEQARLLDPEKRRKRVALEMASETLNPWIQREKPKMSEILEKSRALIEEKQGSVRLAEKIFEGT